MIYNVRQPVNKVYRRQCDSIQTEKKTHAIAQIIHTYTNNTDTYVDIYTHIHIDELYYPRLSFNGELLSDMSVSIARQVAHWIVKRVFCVQYTVLES